MTTIGKSDTKWKYLYLITVSTTLLVTLNKVLGLKSCVLGGPVIQKLSFYLRI